MDYLIRCLLLLQLMLKNGIRSKDVPLRKITSIERLYDVSIVDIPAYDGTSIYSRSLDLVESELRAMDLEKQEKEKALIRSRIKIKLKTEVK